MPLLAINADGEPLPELMVKGLSQSRNQFRFLEMQKQIVLSNFDQTIFGPQPSNSQRMPTKDVWAAMHRQSGVPFAEGTHWFTNIGHLVTYGSAYCKFLHRGMRYLSCERMKRSILFLSVSCNLHLDKDQKLNHLSFFNALFFFLDATYHCATF